MEEVGGAERAVGGDGVGGGVQVGRHLTVRLQDPGRAYPAYFILF